MGYIYLITNKSNGKRYVGQTIHEDIETRWNQHRKMKKTMLGQYIYNAYVKHGIENFDFKIICICFDEACNALETHYIQKFNTLAPDGYNLRAGGNNSKHHEVSKELMRKNRRGKGTGIVYSEEMRRERSQRVRGESNPNYGKSISDEQKKKISDRMKQIWEEKKKNGFTQTDKVKTALAEGNRKRWEKFNTENPKPEKIGKCQKVALIDGTGNILEEFDSIAIASSKYKIQSSKISAVCRGERNQCYGYKWKYVNQDSLIDDRNKTTGERYITKYKRGYMLRIRKKKLNVTEWFHSLEEAIAQRDIRVSEIEALKI